MNWLKITIKRLLLLIPIIIIFGLSLLIICFDHDGDSVLSNTVELILTWMAEIGNY